MLIQYALILSVILQFGAFFICISLIPKTKFSIAWISISFGFLLMAFRRLADLVIINQADSINTSDILSNWIAVVISISMFVASFYIRKIFELLNRVSRIKKDNEAKVLSAIISTEEKERKFFAKELHDGLGPVLSSMKMSLSAINKSILSLTNKEIISKTEFAVDNAITVTKEISNHLNPQVLERYGIKKAIQTFANSSITDKQLNFSIETNLGKLRLDYNQEVILYRISCELLNNTLKHASATNASMNISKYPDKIIFIYDDDGQGFDLTAKRNSGMGLNNIESRVKSLNGLLDIKTHPHKGVFVKIELPL